MLQVLLEYTLYPQQICRFFCFYKRLCFPDLQFFRRFMHRLFSFCSFLAKVMLWCITFCLFAKDRRQLKEKLFNFQTARIQNTENTDIITTQCYFFALNQRQKLEVVSIYFSAQCNIMKLRRKYGIVIFLYVILYSFYWSSSRITVAPSLTNILGIINSACIKSVHILYKCNHHISIM